VDEGLESFYGELATLLGAGITIAEALRPMSARDPSGPASAVLPSIDAGRSLADGMDDHPGTFPPFDRAMVRSGEISGRLETAIRRLAETLARSRALRSRFRAALLYPLFLLHVGLFLLNVPTLFTGGTGPFLGGLFLSFAPLYAAVGAAVFAHRRLRDRERYVDCLRALPLAGPILSRIAFSRALRAAADLYDAGLPVDRAFTAAAEASGPGAFRRGLLVAAASMRSGRGVHDSLAAGTRLPPSLLASIDTGERTGRLFEVLSGAAERCELDADQGLRFAAKAVPFALYLLIMAYFAVKILSFWAGYYGRLSGTGPEAVRRTVSESSWCVENSMNSTSVTPVNRCQVPGERCTTSPRRSVRTSTCSGSVPISSRISPERT
jgi:type II secretory pathway component PulF